jgi:hypothetical protein
VTPENKENGGLEKAFLDFYIFSVQGVLKKYNYAYGLRVLKGCQNVESYTRAVGSSLHKRNKVLSLTRGKHNFLILLFLNRPCRQLIYFSCLLFLSVGIRITCFM